MSQEKFLINFDLDNTLADLAKPILPPALNKMKSLIKQGHILSINSGKPVYYLVGLCRQADLQDIWLIGENGADICYGVDLPLKMPFKKLVNPESKQYLEEIKKEIEEKFLDKIWFEPNAVALSPFFDSPETQKELGAFLQEKASDFKQKKIKVFPHEDCFDLSPDGIDKSFGVKTLKEHLNIPQDKTIAIGDTYNDIPMFEACHHSIIIEFPEIEYEGKGHTYHVKDIEEALYQLDQIIG